MYEIRRDVFDARQSNYRLIVAYYSTLPSNVSFERRARSNDFAELEARYNISQSETICNCERRNGAETFFLHEGPLIDNRAFNRPSLENSLISLAIACV